MNKLADIVADRRLLLAEITSIERELDGIERRHGHGHEAVAAVRARLAAARKDVSAQLYMLTAGDGQNH